MRIVLRLLAAGACLAWSAPAQADIVHLSNGQRVEGIVVSESPSGVRIQMDVQGYMTVSREFVNEIVREDAAVNDARLERWRAEHEEARIRQEARDAFEAEQRAKGLVKYQGDWITPDALGAIRDEESRKELARLERQLEELTDRLEALETENQALRHDLEQRPIFVFPQTELIRRSHDERRGRLLYRDEQGNLIRVQEEGGRKFFLEPDGTRVDLDEHGEHLTFTDSTGTHRDLTPARR